MNKTIWKSILILKKEGKREEVFPEGCQLVSVEGMLELESIQASIINDDENTDEGL